MSPLRKLRHRLRALFRGAQLDREMDEEMHFHLEMEARTKMADDAASPGDARRAAAIAFGGRERVREEMRDARGVRGIEELVRDLRHGVRMLRKRPGYSTTIVLTLALGLGANATVFQFVSEFFLRPLPVKDPDQLVCLLETSPRAEMPFGFSYPDFQDFRTAVDGAGDASQSSDMAAAFSGLLAYRLIPVALGRTGDSTERAWIAAVSDNFFDVLGIPPFRGRFFAENQTGSGESAQPVVILTEAFWRRRFGGDPAIIGQQVQINSLSCTVIGVTPPGFHGAQWMDALSAFVPVRTLPVLRPGERGWLESRGTPVFNLMARLRDGVSIREGNAAASVFLTRLLTDFPQDHLPGKMLVIPERWSRPSPAASQLVPRIIGVLMFGALLVLGVTIANIATLLFARATERTRELAVRNALGAPRSRLLRQLLVESVPIALLAAGIAVVAAHWAGAGLMNTLTAMGDFPPPAQHGTDWRVFAFTFLSAITAAFFAALLPALKATQLAVLPILNDGTRTTVLAHHPLRSTLVVVQVALASIVLVGAGLALRSAQRLASVRVGFSTDHTLLASYDLGLQRYVVRKGFDAARRFHAQLLADVRALPGVRAASLAENVPFDTSISIQGDVAKEDGPPADPSRFQPMQVVAVDHEFFATLGIPLAAGRVFSATDDPAHAPVAILNEAMARRLWPGENAIGHRIVINGNQPPIEIVGVISNVHFALLADASRPMAFLPLAQNYRGALTLVVRTEGDPLALAPSVEHIVRKLEPDLPLYNIRTLEQQIATSPFGLAPIRFGATIVGVQGALALALALTGLYGLVSFNVSRRIREIGVRMALGARASDVILLVVRRSAVLALVGLGVGLPVAALGMQPLAALLYGVRPTDAFVLASVAILIATVTLLACWLPARRATRVNPIEALHTE